MATYMKKVAMGFDDCMVNFIAS